MKGNKDLMKESIYSLRHSESFPFTFTFGSTHKFFEESKARMVFVKLSGYSSTLSSIEDSSSSELRLP